MTTEQNKPHYDQTLVYVRTAHDNAEEDAGLTAQLNQCLALCEHLGIDPDKFDIQKHPGSSASRTRKAFQEMLDYASQGSTRIVVRDLYRLYRRPEDLEALITVAESHPVHVYSVTGPDLDLSTPKGRFLARMMVALAAVEPDIDDADEERPDSGRASDRGERHAR